MRGIVGILLVGAGLLKAVQLIEAPTIALAKPLGQILVPVEIAAELSIGALALTGLYWRQLRHAAAFIFAAFAVYSFYLAMSGAASCGCFGPIKVHPWWTFGLDSAIVVGLGVSMLRPSSVPTWQIAPHQQLAFALTLTAVSVGSAVALGWYATPRSEAALTTVGKLVVLEPERWIGEPLPIAEYLDADFSQGEWIILLHRHDCPDCQKAVPHYEGLAANQKVALVEVPPYGGGLSNYGPALYARMPADREWFVQTPVEIRIRDGVVIDVSTELPAITLAAEL